MRCGRVRLTLFFPLHISNFLYRIENVVCYPFRTANLVDNGTKEGQIGEGCPGGVLSCGEGAYRNLLFNCRVVLTVLKSIHPRRGKKNVICITLASHSDVNHVLTAVGISMECNIPTAQKLV